MSPATQTRLKRLVGYPAFFLAAFGFMLMATFPYRVVSDVAIREARKAGVDLGIGSFGMGLFGPTAKRVSIRPLPAPGKEPATSVLHNPYTNPFAAPGNEPSEPVVIDELTLRPTWTLTGVAGTATLFGGSVSASYSPLGSKPRFEARLRGLDLARANLKAAVGLDLEGKVSGAVDVTIDPKDQAKSVGRVALSGEGLLVKGGTVANYDLPRADLGKLEAELKVGEGKATVQTFQVHGADVEASGEGEIALADRLAFSTLRLKVQFKPADDFLKKNSLVQTGLNFAMARDSRGFYSARLERLLGNPRFVPVR